MNRLTLKNYCIKIATATAFACFLASCGGSKKVAQQPVVTNPPVQAKDYSELYTRVFIYKTFSGKAKMKYDGPNQKQSFSANLKMQKGEKVWASIVALGVAEVARAQITPDKLQAVERLNRNSYDMSFEEGVKKLNAPISFPMLENLLIGNPVMAGLKVQSAKEEGEDIILKMEQDGYQQILIYDKATQTLKQQEIRSEAKKFNCTIDYSDYTVVAGQNFAKNRNIKIEDKNKNQTTILNMEFSSHDVDGAVEFQFSIPSNYKAKSL